MKIYITTSSGDADVYEFDLEDFTTIYELKEMFRKKTQHNKKYCDTLCFMFNGDIVDRNEDTLLSYGIEDDSELALVNGHANGRYLGALGARFVDVTNSKGLTRNEWSKTAPRWRTARRGLCLEGICTNATCDAYNHMVIMGIGYKKFDVLCDPDETTTVCPLCKQYVKPTICGFNNCWWRFEGKKEDSNDAGKPPKKCSCNWIETDDAYHYFNEKASGTVVWKQLIFDVVAKKPIV